MSPRTYKFIQRASLCLSAAVSMTALEIGLCSLLFPPVQAIGLPLLAVALPANFLITLTMPER
ncbi:hypothetical protein GQ56_0128910 [Burkholderia paludis]|uniref:hypothetical protein n=1 Tax=Burkholderia paludis TaxID=1506587 RepID=UPI0004DB54BC|nr:hypothetical protein [Burkholderia paludis]KFG93940.1 hypothetical protein GQ56_0128910 [Burkholderia paludis]